MGQPNLSRAIKELETKLGMKLFERTRGGIKVTGAGEHFLQYAEKIVAQLDELENMYGAGGVEKVFSLCAVEGVHTDAVISKAVDGTEKYILRKSDNCGVLDAVCGREANLGIIMCVAGEENVYRYIVAEKRLECQKLARIVYQSGDMKELYKNIFSDTVELELILVSREGYELTDMDRRFIDSFRGTLN